MIRKKVVQVFIGIFLGSLEWIFLSLSLNSAQFWSFKLRYLKLAYVIIIIYGTV